MITIDIDISKVTNEVKPILQNIAKDIEEKAYKAFRQTAIDVKDLVWQNMSKKKNAYNQTMESEAESTIKRKGFSSPLRDTTRMQRGLIPREISKDEYSIEFTNKSEIYSKYLHDRKNWQVLQVTDYIIRNAIKFMNRNYGR